MHIDGRVNKFQVQILKKARENFYQLEIGGEFLKNKETFFVNTR